MNFILSVEDGILTKAGQLKRTEIKSNRLEIESDKNDNEQWFKKITCKYRSEM